MGRLVDCHVHTVRCGHGEGVVADYVRAAERRGLAGVAITEHLPLPDDLDPVREYSMPACDLASYAQEVKDASSDLVDVALGVEADWLPGRMDHVESLLGEVPWDVVLGSVHFLDDWAFDDPALVSEWDRRDVDAVWESYFDRLVDAASSGLFDVMAHPDLVKKFGHRPATDATALYDEAAAAFAAAGVAAELSTAGLRKPVGEAYPSEGFLAALARHNVPISLGSDAHAPAEVGHAFEDAVSILRRTGYTSISWFRERKRSEVPL